MWCLIVEKPYLNFKTPTLYYRQSGSPKVRIAPAIELSQEEEAELIRLAHFKLSSVRLAERARIVLLAAQGLQNLDLPHVCGRFRFWFFSRGLAQVQGYPPGLPVDSLDRKSVV